MSFLSKFTSSTLGILFLFILLPFVMAIGIAIYMFILYCFYWSGYFTGWVLNPFLGPAVISTLSNIIGHPITATLSQIMAIISLFSGIFGVNSVFYSAKNWKQSDN